jgi:uncharacterized protein (UPF0332 family)
MASDRREEIVQLIRQARESVQRAMELSEFPGLKKALQDADMMLHWSLWHLGAEEALTPEAERETVQKG